MPRRRLAVVVLAVTCALFGQAIAAPADAPLLSIANPADVVAPAAYITSLGDAVSVYQTGTLSTSIRDDALAAASAAGAAAVTGRGFSAGMTSVRRGTTVIQQSSGPGWGFPMSISALPLESLGGIFGRTVASPISQGFIIMGQTSAGIRGAIVGDRIELMTSGGGTVTFTIGMVAPDGDIGGTEILMSSQQATLLGANLDTRVLIYGRFDRTTLQSALAANGLTSNSKVRVRRSWDAPDPDSTMSMSQTKALLGEFQMDYANLSTLGWTSVDAAWRNTYLPPARETYPAGIRALCNTAVKADLMAALQEVVDAGLAGGIDATNSNRDGGCSAGQARLARITQSLGSVSRHSWGQPIDMNTVANCQGCVPKMDCSIVRIFRKHNFAWGGNFLTPDGMHFEWVGEARNLQQYPSRYCPNLPGGQLQSADTTPPPTSRETLFADDGLSQE
ncbi:MAG TPA: M15 family metallopeptidase [Ilumatobacteraceae bacterium]|nr:M15 family metallopeptidase [Ilumatobacteraceae bacterium]